MGLHDWAAAFQFDWNEAPLGSHLKSKISSIKCYEKQPFVDKNEDHWPSNHILRDVATNR